MIKIKELKSRPQQCDSCGSKDNSLTYYALDANWPRKIIQPGEYYICENCLIDLMDNLLEFLPNTSNWYGI